MSVRITALVAATVGMMAVSGGASADSISSVENARAKDRAGDYLSRQDRDQLRKYGRTSEADDGVYYDTVYADDIDDDDDDVEFDDDYDDERYE